ncbi:SVM family protein [Candidatus Phytoplasma asteris]|uniref:SVM family protein n=3 Tax=16SrI (Aster yellows group) TaxID=3042590 RepID=A0ABZ3CCC5_9MOLU|nr:MAG: putative secreted protein, SAP21-like [Rapeseed phyllody phytoplasma]
MLIFRLKKQLYLLPIALFIYLGLFLFTNHHQVMAMDNKKHYIKNKKTSTDIKKELFNLLTNKKELEDKIHYFRNKKQVNLYERDIVLKLEIEHNELKSKISEIYKNNSKMSKVTFNLKPLIKIIED